jgi:hypothetical protein
VGITPRVMAIPCRLASVWQINFKVSELFRFIFFTVIGTSNKGF